jgi:hypothetical protein
MRRIRGCSLLAPVVHAEPQDAHRSPGFLCGSASQASRLHRHAGPLRWYPLAGQCTSPVLACGRLAQPAEQHRADGPAAAPAVGVGRRAGTGTAECRSPGSTAHRRSAGLSVTPEELGRPGTSECAYSRTLRGTQLTPRWVASGRNCLPGLQRSNSCLLAEGPPRRDLDWRRRELARR